jgi:hypothetical protein
MAGVNAELMPFVRMTFPRGAERIDKATAAAGKPLFRSVLLLFGVLPIDVHRLALVKLDPGGRLPRMLVLASAPALDPRAPSRCRG